VARPRLRAALRLAVADGLQLEAVVVARPLLRALRLAVADAPRLEAAVVLLAAVAAAPMRRCRTPVHVWSKAAPHRAASALYRGGGRRDGRRHFRRGAGFAFFGGAPYYDYDYDYATPYAYYDDSSCWRVRLYRGEYRRVWVCE